MGAWWKEERRDSDDGSDATTRGRDDAASGRCGVSSSSDMGYGLWVASDMVKQGGAS